MKHVETTLQEKLSVAQKKYVPVKRRLLLLVIPISDLSIYSGHNDLKKLFFQTTIIIMWSVPKMFFPTCIQ